MTGPRKKFDQLGALFPLGSMKRAVPGNFAGKVCGQRLLLAALLSWGCAASKQPSDALGTPNLEAGVAPRKATAAATLREIMGGSGTAWVERVDVDVAG